jgi:hypothetical protein
VAEFFYLYVAHPGANESQSNSRAWLPCVHVDILRQNTNGDWIKIVSFHSKMRVSKAYSIESLNIWFPLKLGCFEIMNWLLDAGELCWYVEFYWCTSNTISKQVHWWDIRSRTRFSQAYFMHTWGYWKSSLREVSWRERLLGCCKYISFMSYVACLIITTAGSENSLASSSVPSVSKCCCNPMPCPWCLQLWLSTLISMFHQI